MTDPTEFWEIVQSGGVSGVLFVGVCVFIYLYISERNSRTNEIKASADKFLEYSKTIDKVTSAIDALTHQVERLTWERKQ